MPGTKYLRSAVCCVMAVLFLAAPLARAQKNEAAFLAGAALTPGQFATVTDIGFDPSLTFQMEYDRKVLHLPAGSLLVGLDFAASPLDVKHNSGPPSTISQHAYLCSDAAIAL